jgi:hypothetical protein
MASHRLSVMPYPVQNEQGLGIGNEIQDSMELLKC